MSNTLNHDRYALTEAVIGAMIQVHRHLGPGLLESTYEACLAEELQHRGIPFARQVPVDITYRDVILPCVYQADVIVEGRLLLELKAVEALAPIHLAQTLTYLKLLGLEVGLLVNFNALTIKDGLRRVVRAPLTDGDERQPRKVVAAPHFTVRLR